MNDEQTILLRFYVEGPSACFRRPEFVEDFVSYDVITPLAAGRMIRSAYDCKAPLNITEISVVRPIQGVWGSIDDRHMFKLLDAAYTISITSNVSDADQSYPFDTRSTFLGLKSLAGKIRRLPADEVVISALARQSAIDLGWMVYDVIGRGKARARFYRPTMIGGVIDVARTAMGHLPG